MDTISIGSKAKLWILSSSEEKQTNQKKSQDKYLNTDLIPQPLVKMLACVYLHIID